MSPMPELQEWQKIAKFGLRSIKDENYETDFNIFCGTGASDARLNRHGAEQILLQILRIFSKFRFLSDRLHLL